ncbi:MAG: hypothetical protein KY464_18865, partial [Gemmatimonadetes bacterium]|nr:hypothetical protein [Gemmatimonadota bacterium]
FTQISAGRAHTCAVGTGSRVLCWGDADYAAIGARTAAESCNQYGCKLMPARSPVPVRTTAELTSVAASPGLAWYTHSCGLNTAGHALCWGTSYPVQLGTTRPYSGCTGGGSYSHPCSFVPVRVELPVELRTVGAGLGFSCGLSTAGEVYCWGANTFLMTGEGADRTGKPARIATEHRFVALSVGDLHSCALDAEGAAFCWGYNRHGQLGTADALQRAVPTRAAGELRFSSVDAGTGVTCGVTIEQRVHCWGGDTAGVVAGAAAARAKNLLFRSVDVGEAHACGIAVGGEAYCWGSNRSGELGSGAASPDLRSEPSPVAGRYRWTSLSAGVGYTCGVTTAGEAYCWGTNLTGQLGIGSEDASRPAPTRVAGQAPPRA